MFRTELPFTPASRQLSRTARVLTLGSCFADTIGARLAAHKVHTLVNPFGTVFNPHSAALLLRAAAGEGVDWQQHLVEARGRWQSYDLHGSHGADSPAAMLQLIQDLVQRTADFVRNADVLVLTLGTAWAYRLRETGELVNNCHKMPAALFEKELLTTEEIVASLAETHAILRRLNPRLRVILTVSPVRHLRDTLQLNSVSKGVLRVACHYLSDMVPDMGYFPAYELLLDDLRDYRFYADDMLHPSRVAEDYIWERFARTYFDADFGRFRKEWNNIQQALSHRPLHPGAPEHRQFLESTLERLRRLQDSVEVRGEIRDVERRLLALPPPPRPIPAAQPEPDDDEERIDIGEAEDSSPRPEPAPRPAQEQRPPRQERPERPARTERPEREGRHQRNRPEPAVMPAPEPVMAPELVMAEVAPMPEAVTEAPAAVGEEPFKKKKRRSRGGAKRTARKLAAKMAAEQGEVRASGEESPFAAEAEPASVVVHEEAPARVEAALTAEAPVTAELPVADLPLTEPELTPAVEREPEAPTEEQPAEAAEAAPSRKRGTRAPARKSSVITKSTPVKRSTRGAKAAATPAAAPEPVAAPVAELTPAPEPTPAAEETAAAPPKAKAAARKPAARKAKSATPAVDNASPVAASVAEAVPTATDNAAPAGEALADAAESPGTRKRGRPPGTKKVRRGQAAE